MDHRALVKRNHDVTRLKRMNNLKMEAAFGALKDKFPTRSAAADKIASLHDKAR